MSSKSMFYGLFLIFLIDFSAGYEIFFQQAELTLTVPIVKSQRNVVDKNPIIKLKALALTANSTVTFSLEENHDFLQLDKITGELWFKQDNWEKDSSASHELVITAEKSDGAVARMSIDLHVQHVDDVKEFCRDHLCFYESITYHAIEDFHESFKPREIGELAPKLYGRLCSMFEVNYELLNASEFISIKSNKLFSSAPLNHEMMSPGPELKIDVQCSIKHGFVTQLSSKVFNVTVIDRNDNMIKVQDPATNLTLDSPYFKQDTLLNPHSFIVFKDDDTSTANANIDFHLLHDKAEIFQETCTKLQLNHTSMESTVFYCNLKYTKDGHFTSSPYCVVLQAREVIRGKTMTENATVCIFTNLTSVTHGAEILPRPEKLRSRDNKNGKIKTINSNPAQSDLKTSSVMEVVVDYPATVELLQNASSYARVVEPIVPVANNKIGFKLLKNSLNIFDITRSGGIVYVLNSAKLENALPASYELAIGWNNQVKTVKVNIIEANNNCSTLLDSKTDFCSRYEFQEDCENACGFGSGNGRCKWRPMNATSPKAAFSDVYTTCTPDIVSCSDKVCDPLEKFGRRKYPQIQICPQDCTMETVIGWSQERPQGIGKVPLGFVCTCEHEEQCHCAAPHRVPTTIQPEVIASFHNSSSHELTMDSPITSMRSSADSDCGRACMLITIASPTFLVTIIVTVIIVRRRYVKKMKKRYMFYVCQTRTLNDFSPTLPNGIYGVDVQQAYSIALSL